MFWAVLKKELVVEWRTKEVLYTSVFFAVLLATIFMFGFFAGEATIWKVGPGVLWIALAFTGTIAFSRSFAREREAGCMDALRLIPGIHSALLWGKCLSNMILLVVMEAVLVPLVAVVFRLDLGELGTRLALLLALGTIGLSTLGTLLGAALVNIRLRELLLPLVLFPLIVPLLVGGVSGTEALMRESSSSYWDWVKLMAAFDAIYVVLATWLFRTVIEATE
jgi:heme exporter protein B